MTSFDLKPGPSREVVTCPRCRSIECRTNRIGNRAVDEVAGDVWAAHRSGRRAQGLRTLLAWASVELANALRDDWQCDHCRESFR